MNCCMRMQQFAYAAVGIAVCGSVQYEDAPAYYMNCSSSSSMREQGAAQRGIKFAEAMWTYGGHAGVRVVHLTLHACISDVVY